MRCRLLDIGIKDRGVLGGRMQNWELPVVLMV